MKTSLTILLLGIVFITGPILAGGSMDPANSYEPALKSHSLDMRLARDLMLIERYEAAKSPKHTSRLTSCGLPANPDPSLKVFLYFDEMPDIELHTTLEAEGVELFPQTWVPPVGNHPYGFMLARVKASSIKKK